MTTPTFDSFAIDRSLPALFTDRRDDGDFISGYVTTRWGTVGVWSWRPKDPAKLWETSYSFARNGREFRMFERRERTNRGITIMAGRFARQHAVGRA